MVNNVLCNYVCFLLVLKQILNHLGFCVKLSAMTANLSF